MGVIGLTSLIEVNPHLMSDIDLRDTNLIIDGNSFCYQIFNASRIDSRFGGDYPKFEDVIVNLLDQFDSCGIRLTFVFDGLLDVETLKRETALQRQKTRLLTAKSIVSLTSRASLLPVLAQNVLINILIDRGLEIYQCAGEADGIAVGLANDRRAPLLSQDSDFFIFDLKFGYVPFDTLEWNIDRCEPKPSFLRAKLYRLDNLLEYYPNVDRRLLPLFAFLCGNDFSAGCNMTKFFEHIHRPNVEIAGGQEVTSRRRRSNKGDRPMRRHCNMIAVLEWLRDKDNEEKAIEEALSWIELKRREKIQQAVRRSMAAYRRCESIENSSNGLPTRFDPVAITKRNVSHLDLPQWFVDEYVVGRVPAVLLHVRQDRMIFLPALIEDFTAPSVYDCCQILRSAAYNILLKSEPVGRRFVTEYSRYGANFVKRIFSVADVDYGDQPVLSALPGLADVEKVDIVARRQLFFDAFQFTAADLEAISKFPLILSLFVSSFLFWCRSAETQVQRSQACALLICAVSFCCRKGNGPRILQVGDEQLQNLEFDYDFTPFSSKKRGIHLAISSLHSFNQWQACFQASMWLDTLLMHPFGPTVLMHRLFHGRIAYNLTMFFEKSKSETAALEHIFKDKPLLSNVFVELWKAIQACVPEWDSPSNLKKANRKSRNKKLANVTIVECTTVDSASDNGDKESQESSDNDWGLENRFKMLVSLK